MLTKAPWKGAIRYSETRHHFLNGIELAETLIANINYSPKKLRLDNVRLKTWLSKNLKLPNALLDKLEDNLLFNANSAALKIIEPATYDYDFAALSSQAIYTQQGERVTKNTSLTDIIANNYLVKDRCFNAEAELYQDCYLNLNSFAGMTEGTLSVHLENPAGSGSQLDEALYQFEWQLGESRDKPAIYLPTSPDVMQHSILMLLQGNEQTVVAKTHAKPKFTSQILLNETAFEQVKAELERVYSE